MKILITGVAGFIGSSLAQSLLVDGNEVIGIDNLNDYYSPELKKLRLNSLTEYMNFTFIQMDISDEGAVNNLLKNAMPETVYHLAAQAGVRLPIQQFDRYIQSNLTGFANVAIAAIINNIPNFLYASSSSVYGSSVNFPYSEDEQGLTQVSFYGATKFANEVLATSLSKQFENTRFRGLRFFTVYGPMGRPDMAYFRLINSAINKQVFHLFGDGSVRRDFTYITDVITSIKLLAVELESRNSGYSDIVNVGGGKPSSMLQLIECVNQINGNQVHVVIEKSVKSDVKETIASHKLQESLTGFVPTISLRDGIEKVFRWSQESEVRSNLIEWIK